MTTKKEISEYYDGIKHAFRAPEQRHYNTVKVVSPLEGKVLEIGCAQGFHSQIAMELNKNIATFGLDISMELIREASKRSNVHVLQGDAEELPFKSKTIDAVFLMEVLEHLLEPEKAMLEINRVLKCMGKLIFSVPNKWWFFPYVPYLSRHYKPMTQIVDRKYSHMQVREIMKKYGFRIIRGRHSGPILGKRYDKYICKIPGSIFFTKRIWLLLEKKS